MKKRFNFSINSIVLIGVFLIFASSCEKDEEITKEESGSFTDARDGNIYQTVTIGNQVWMAEDLRATHYVDGRPVPLANNGRISSASSAADEGVNGDARIASNVIFYTWDAAMNGEESSNINPSRVQGVCPEGWHLPSDAEWTAMERSLANNGYNYDGTLGGERDKIAKSMASTTGWASSTIEGAVGNFDYPEFRNKSGFSAQPNGFIKVFDSSLDGIGEFSYWWSSTAVDNYEHNAFYRALSHRLSQVYRASYFKDSGHCVRCLKD
ncbi:MAG: fibrobacter succinogenes major paralogous domain-containing protein [Cyclobacteriaceae bacterium]